MADVRFTYQGKVTLLPWSKHFDSREALGIWQVRNQAWKVYNTRKELQKLMQDYLRADVDVSLPMGNYGFLEGKVQQGNESEKDGFVLFTDWMTGTKFQKSQSSFKAALSRQSIPHSKSDETYKRILRACMGADTVGLRDCQGFVLANAANPLQFVDIHTGWNKNTNKYNPSEQAKELVETMDEWGNED